MSSCYKRRGWEQGLGQRTTFCGFGAWWIRKLYLFKHSSPQPFSRPQLPFPTPFSPNPAKKQPKTKTIKGWELSRNIFNGSLILSCIWMRAYTLFSESLEVGDGSLNWASQTGATSRRLFGDRSSSPRLLDSFWASSTVGGYDRVIREKWHQLTNTSSKTIRLMCIHVYSVALQHQPMHCWY